MKEVKVDYKITIQGHMFYGEVTFPEQDFLEMSHEDMLAQIVDDYTIEDDYQDQPLQGQALTTNGEMKCMICGQ